MSLLAAPTSNGPKRIRPYTFAPTHVCWGLDNRTVLARCIVEPGSMANRVEFRSAGADANPYLIIAGVLAAGIDGVERSLKPPPMSVGNMYSNPGKHAPLATDLTGAIAAYADSPLAAQLGEFFSKSYVSLALAEVALAAEHSPDPDDVNEWERGPLHRAQLSKWTPSTSLRRASTSRASLTSGSRSCARQLALRGTRMSRRGSGPLPATRMFEAVSKAPDIFSSAIGHSNLWDLETDALEARRSIIDSDAPDHTRLRRLVSKAFTPKNIRSWEQTARDIAAGLLDEFVRRGGGDWVELVGAPLPIQVILSILGVPIEDADYLVELSNYLVEGTGTNRRCPQTPTATRRRFGSCLSVARPVMRSTSTASEWASCVEPSRPTIS